MASSVTDSLSLMYFLGIEDKTDKNQQKITCLMIDALQSLEKNSKYDPLHLILALKESGTITQIKIHATLAKKVLEARAQGVFINNEIIKVEISSLTEKQFAPLINQALKIHLLMHPESQIKEILIQGVSASSEQAPLSSEESSESCCATT